MKSKFSQLFHSFNVIECTLGYLYISVTLRLLQTYPSGKPLSKGQGPVNLTSQPANIGPQDVPRTSTSNVPRTSPKGPI